MSCGEIASSMSARYGKQLLSDRRGSLGTGIESLEHFADRAEQFALAHRLPVGFPSGVAVTRWEALLIAPVPDPLNIRDFRAFAEHVAHAVHRRGRAVPSA